MIIPITIDLLLLGFFKYANFIASSICEILGWTGYAVSYPRWEIILPIGISFYTFHTITYIVDCYRRDIKPTRNFFEFAAYVSLFSQLVAGPIVRFRQIEEDLERLGKADRTRWLAKGISYFLWGMVEKVVVADTLASFVDPAFANVKTLTSVDAWLAVIGYTFQLYFDFSGYSDMAIGLGLMFGLRIPINFFSPYKALDPSDFWRRWHISLSSCLRDYLYIPLGGNRGGEWKTKRNLMLTMLIGGLWHGANWTFVIWGAYHGALLILYRIFGKWWDKISPILRHVLMFILVMFGWILFRAENLHSALTIFYAMFSPKEGYTTEHIDILITVLILSGAWAMVWKNAHEWHAGYKFEIKHAYVWAIIFGACCAIMAGNRNSPFLYFQF